VRADGYYRLSEDAARDLAGAAYLAARDRGVEL